MDGFWRKWGRVRVGGGGSYRSTSSPFSFSIFGGWVGGGGGLGWLLLWLWMSVRCLGHGLISVCGGRLVAWRIQPYGNVGAKACKFCNVVLCTYQLIQYCVVGFYVFLFNVSHQLI